MTKFHLYGNITRLIKQPYLVMLVTLVIIVTIFTPGRLVSGKDKINTNPNDSVTFSMIPESIDTSYGLDVSEEKIKAGLMYDLNNNKIVWGKNILNRYPIASITKMMVALITIEDIKECKFDWETPVKVTREACMTGGSSVLLRPGQVYSVNDLLHASMIASGNDACYLLAQWNGKTEKAFVDRMNLRAAVLGMSNTRFSNSTGMPAPRGEQDNYSSSRDLLLLALELIKHEELLNISCKPNECIKKGYRPMNMRNHNGLVKEYPEVNGLKTGWTNNAGYCIVATANRAGQQMISIVLGAPKVYTRNTIVASMLNDYFQTVGLGKMGEVLDSSMIDQSGILPPASSN